MYRLEYYTYPLTILFILFWIKFLFGDKSISFKNKILIILAVTVSWLVVYFLCLCLDSKCSTDIPSMIITVIVKLIDTDDYIYSYTLPTQDINFDD